MTTDPGAEFWKLAGDVCTQKQLQVLQLREKHGASIYQMSYMLDLSPSTIRGHLAAATRNVRRALQPEPDQFEGNVAANIAGGRYPDDESQALL